MKTSTKRMFALLLSAVLLLSCAMPVFAQEQEKDRLIQTKDYWLLDALYRAQGVATDGEHLYFGSNEFVFLCSDILKTTFDGDAVNINPNAIPFDAKLDACFHVGGIDYADGFIYAAIEDPDYNNPYVAVFDAETLELVRYKRLPVAATTDGQPIEEKKNFDPANGDIRMHTDGVPWVAVDEKRNVFYTAEWSDADRLNVFDLDTFAFIGFLELTDQDGNTALLHRCQGADVYGDVLYTSCDIGSEQPFFAVDLRNGVMTHLFDRNLGENAEAEGMCVQTTEDGVRFISQYYEGIKVTVCTYDVSDLVLPSEDAKTPVQLGFFEKLTAFFKTVLFGLFNMFSPTTGKAM